MAKPNRSLSRGTLRVLKQEINNKVRGIHENMNSNRKLMTLSSQAISDTVSLTEGMLNANMPITVYPATRESASTMTLLCPRFHANSIP
ncbi:putative ribonuclease H protein [Senna tora]|uniref:Putative ribonuclease H protein n=1 Tax=Senna tora TaxID=362788 RepID=A0A834WLA7_9FABA|nr:putative ribonuclease H protein [Senna tora]